MQKYVTIKELLEMSGVSRHMLYIDMENKKIEAVRFGRNVRFTLEAAQAYAESKKNSQWVRFWKEKKNTTQQQI